MSTFRSFQSKSTSEKRSEHNATQSLFARLPAEIRYMIWHLSLGDRILHVEYDGVYVCQSDWTPRDEYLSWKAALHSKLRTPWSSSTRTTQDVIAHSTPLPQLNDEHEHDGCLSRQSSRSLRQLSAGKLLRSCKLVNRELTEVFWSTNCFLFNDPRVFWKFMSIRTMAQKQLVSHLYFCGDFGPRWQEHLPSHLVACLTNLKKLNARVSGRVTPALSSARGYTSIVTVLECLSRFKILPIQECSIIIEDVAMKTNLDLSKLLKPTPAAQCLKWSSSLEVSILEGHASEMEMKQLLDSVLLQQVCPHSSTESECHLVWGRYRTIYAQRCRKLHICRICFEDDEIGDIHQRLEKARTCSAPGKCSTDEFMEIKAKSWLERRLTT